MLIPDFPFPYDEFIRHADGIGSVPEDMYGREVAVVGAGMAGLVAAFELMKMGLRPVIYESADIGGRLRGERFGHNGPVADLGGMRFPTSGHTFSHYLDLLDIDTSPFPNPLAPASPSTVIALGGTAHYAQTLDDLPAEIREVGDAWTDCLQERAALVEMQEAIRARDYATIKRLWNELVPTFDGMSFYGYLSSSKAFSELPYEAREIFGQVGFGTGGWDTNFPDSILEVLRIVYGNSDDDHQRIEGGAISVAHRLWAHEPESLVHWPAGTSLRSLHHDSPLPGVTAITRERMADGTPGQIRITDRWNRERTFDAVIVTCQTWLLSARIDCDESLFSSKLWMAIERNHYMQASKTFVMVDRPFWHDTDPQTGRHVMSTTLTDRIIRGTYLIDNGPDRPAMICLSYTWNDDSLKWMPLSAEERVKMALHSLSKIYPGVDIASHIMGEPITVSWEADPNFMGAFSDNLPGHYRYQERLFTHFKQDSFDDAHRGIYLAGDDISWTGGWIEGAVTTGLNAVWGVMDQFGGRCAPANPGPGDRFEELRPIRLDPPALPNTTVPQPQEQ